MNRPLANARHEAFAQALAKGSTADAAYAECGYRPNRGNAIRLKANEHIRSRVAALIDARAERAVVEIAEVIDALARIAFTGMSRFLRIGPDGEPIIDLSACTPADLDLLAEATVDDVTDGNRNVRRVKIKMLDKMKALESLGKHLGMGNKTRIAATEGLAQALMEINARGSAAPIATARGEVDYRE